MQVVRFSKNVQRAVYPRWKTVQNPRIKSAHILDADFINVAADFAADLPQVNRANPCLSCQMQNPSSQIIVKTEKCIKQKINQSINLLSVSQQISHVTPSLPHCPVQRWQIMCRSLFLLKYPENAGWGFRCWQERLPCRAEQWEQSGGCKVKACTRSGSPRARPEVIDTVYTAGYSLRTRKPLWRDPVQSGTSRSGPIRSHILLQVKKKYHGGAGEQGGEPAI